MALHKSALDEETRRNERERNELIRHKSSLIDDSSTQEDEELTRHKNSIHTNPIPFERERYDYNRNSPYYSRGGRGGDYYTRGGRGEYNRYGMEPVLSTLRFDWEHEPYSSHSESIQRIESPIEMNSPIIVPKESSHTSQTESSSSNLTANSLPVPNANITANSMDSTANLTFYSANTSFSTAPSSNATQVTVIRRNLPQFGQNPNMSQNLNLTRNLNLTGSSSTVSKDSRDSGRGSTGRAHNGPLNREVSSLFLFPLYMDTNY